jgi:arsenical pump membrane protein
MTTGAPGWGPTVLALVGLIAALGVAVVRPPRVREAYVAVPFAIALLAVHGVTGHAAATQVRDLIPVVLFLLAVLVLAGVCAAEGLFESIGDLARRRADANPRRLLLIVVVVAASTTAILSLDTTVVLLTPVVLATVRRARMAAAPFLLVTVHLANSASLLLPVSNLTNLLALHRSGLDFSTFTARMTLPWLGAVAVEYGAVRLLHRRELMAGPVEPAGEPAGDQDGDQDGEQDGAVAGVPRFALVVVLATLAGFAVTGPFGIAPVWVAATGAVVLSLPALIGHRTTGREIARSAGVDFAVFVLAIAVIVLALAAGPLGRRLAGILPTGTSWTDLLVLALIATVLANVVNNLPATLLLLGLLPTGVGALPVLAVLIGVNVGPNLAYPGSLATLLWRRALPEALRPSLREFSLLGLVTVPVILLLGVTALWVTG